VSSPEVDEDLYIKIEDPKTGRTKIGALDEGKEGDIEIDAVRSGPETRPEDFEVVVDRLSSQIGREQVQTVDDTVAAAALEDEAADPADVDSARKEISGLNQQAQVAVETWNQAAAELSANEGPERPMVLAETEGSDAAVRLEKLGAQLTESKGELPQLREEAQVALAEATDDMTSRQLWDLASRAEKFSDSVAHISRLEKRIAGPDGKAAEVSAEDTQLIEDIKSLRERGNAKYDKENAEKRKDKPREPQSVEDLDDNGPDGLRTNVEEQDKRQEIDRSRSRLRQQYDDLRDSGSRIRGIIDDPDSNGFYLGNAFDRGRRLEEYTQAVTRVMRANEELSGRLGVASETEIADLSTQLKASEARLADFDDYILRLGHTIIDAGQGEMRDSRVADIGARLVNIARRNQDALGGNQ